MGGIPCPHIHVISDRRGVSDQTRNQGCALFIGLLNHLF
nr:MAG TPA: hypothetical protein [Caudoviricetes sp.]